jgi:fructose-1,6-bisphosphatase/inositol monophosphatase family enzyme
MQSPLTSFIATAMQKPSRFLYRDFFELELSQSSKHMTDAFVTKAYMRTSDALTAELRKHPRAGIVGEGEPIKGKINFSISAIDGMKNLTRSLPFFSISVCAYYVGDDGISVPQACVIDFPALGEIYYLEQGKGAMLVKNASANASIKLKPSVHSNPHMAIVSEEHAHFIACEKRNFGCFSYELGLLAAGKADILVSNESAEHFVLMAKLFTEETGCKILSTTPMVVSNGHCVLELG